MNSRELDYSEYINSLYNEADLTVKNITFQVTEDCTLCCKYCYQHNKSPKVMSLDVAKKFINLLFTEENYKKYKGFILDFIGGEPLLMPNLINDIVDYFDEKCLLEHESGFLYSRLSICTNGTEYDKPDVQRLMKKFAGRLSMSVSIDGNKELHDSARIHPDGSGSYDEAIHAANDLEERYKYNLGSKMTIAPSNIIFTYVAIKHYLDQGKDRINANCVFEKGGTLDHAKLFYEQLKKLADYKLKCYPDAYVSLFDTNYFMPMNESDDRNGCGGTGAMLACDPDGVLYPCLRYMPSSVGRNRESYVTCGNVNDGLDETILDELSKITRRSQSTDECFYCPIGKGCAWCSAYNWESQGSANKRATYICVMHKARALANVYYGNKYYRQIGSKERFKNYCPENWALEIISNEELNLLNSLSKD